MRGLPPASTARCYVDERLRLLAPRRGDHGGGAGCGHQVRWRPAIASLPQREQRSSGWSARGQASRCSRRTSKCHQAGAAVRARQHRTAGKGRCAISPAQSRPMSKLWTPGEQREGPRPSRWRPCLRTHRCPCSHGAMRSEQDEACAWPSMRCWCGRKPAEEALLRIDRARSARTRAGQDRSCAPYWPSCQIPACCNPSAVLGRSRWSRWQPCSCRPSRGSECLAPCWAGVAHALATDPLLGHVGGGLRTALHASLLRMVLT